jgi:phosphoribosylanthranilate isomerase
VVVDAGAAELEAWKKIAPFDLWQLHGQESAEFCREVKDRGFRVIKALGFPLRQKISPEAYPVAAFLLDKASPQHGGTGESFDWSLGSGFVKTAGKPCILSGGLTPENVVQAIQTVQPYAVDVCSGVEAQPGRKDRRKVEEFIALCRTQSPAPL